MKNGPWSYALGLVSCLVLCMMLFTPASFAADERLVRLLGGIGPQTDQIRVEPETLMVQEGTVVVWLNWVKGEEVKLTFREGKKCDDATEAASGFGLDAENCYVTSWVPMGGTSSLIFSEKGTYPYEVQQKGKGAKHMRTGKIVVY